ncbi:MAG: plasmid partitioning protein RepA [Loktanella sp.]|nr:plasmid partitioning protein RepA [Loktanella sp.]
MSGIRASQRFDVMSKRLGSRLREHAEETFPPDAQKGLRRFAMREAAELIRLNQNTFRHHVSNLDGFPQGTLEGGNRRSFSAEELVEAQRMLLETGRIKPEEHPHRQPGEPCQVLTIFNLKGGSAKTSSVAHIGQLLGLRGYRVLLIDLDSQASLTNLFGVTPELDPDMPTSYDLVRAENPLPASDVIRKTNFPTVDLIPASMDIMEYEFEVALSFRQGTTTFHSQIRDALEPVLDQYDVVIFDTPPQLNFSVISALFASTGVLIPLNASMLDVMSLASFLGMASNLMGVVESHAPAHGLQFVRVLITRYEHTDSPQVQISSLLRTVLGEAVLPAEFLKSTAIGDAANTQQSVFEVEPRDVNRRTYERAIDSVSRVTDEIEREIRKAWGRTDGT